MSNADILKYTSGRDMFPRPEEAPGPQLLELHGPAQVALDLCQLQVGLGVQPLGIGQKLVVHDLLLRDERSEERRVGKECRL